MGLINNQVTLHITTVHTEPQKLKVLLKVLQRKFLSKHTKLMTINAEKHTFFLNIHKLSMKGALTFRFIDRSRIR